MKRILFILLPVMLTNCSENIIRYPETKKNDVSDNYFGSSVSDPYRWLEDDNAPETANWVKKQNETTFNYLDKLPGRESIKARLTELWDYPKTQTPFNISGRWFVFKNNGLQNQSVLFLMPDTNSEPVELLDPNKLSEDGTIAFAGMDVSPDGKFLVYKIARSGSDWNEIFVMDIESRNLLPDHIEWVKFSGISCFDNGFFYSAYNKPSEEEKLSKTNTGQKVYFHEYGTDQDSDKLIYANSENPKRMYSTSIDTKREWLFLYESESTTGNGLYVKSLKTPNGPVQQLAEGFRYDYSVVEVVDGKAFVLTNDNAPTYKLITIDLNNPQKEFWQEIIPQKEKILEGSTYCGGKLFANYIEHACSNIEIYQTNGQELGTVNLPGICTASNISGTFDGTEAFYSFSSFNTPSSIYRYQTENGQSELFFQPELKFNPDDFVVKQEFYTSKDGTRIPMFIVHKKGLKMNGKNPALLYGYGGFNISLTPGFSVPNLFYVENGGIYVVANTRGGGEYGEDWHLAGTLKQKQNVFDDFIAAAEYLIAEKYTRPTQLTIRGGSNGGLLIGAVTNQRPDLFKVSLPAVGVLDMLRYHLFTIGYAWATDYGRSDDDEEMFRYLLSYSPYHNIEAKAYPAILATTADHDDRVVPAHTFKYISRMQELNTGKLPTLVRIDVKAGHGAGKPTTKIIEEYTDIFSFVFYHTGIKIK